MHRIGVHQYSLTLPPLLLAESKNGLTILKNSDHPKALSRNTPTEQSVEMPPGNQEGTG